MEIATTAAADYGFLRELVFGLTRNVLDPSRDYLFETRLSKLLRNQGMNRVEELVRRLRASRNPALENAVAEAMTINETSFFRDVRPFDLLRTELQPKIVEARQFKRSLRFWSAASSTGQEAYSLAMMMLEHFPRLVGLGHLELKAPTFAPWKWLPTPALDVISASKLTVACRHVLWSATSITRANTGP